MNVALKLGQERVVHSTTVASLATRAIGRHNKGHMKRDLTSPATNLGDLIRQLRAERGLNVSELARRSGMNRSSLKRIEDGDTAHPDVRSLNMLARALGVDPEVLYDVVWWQDTKTPLPSANIYFRSKYHLMPEQVAEIETSIRQMRDASPSTASNQVRDNERRSP